MRELFPPGELTEFAGFVAAVNCGLVIGIMYDLFALLRKPIQKRGDNGNYRPALLCRRYGSCGAYAAVYKLPARAAVSFCRDSIGNIPVCTFPGRLIRAKKAKKAKFTKKQLR